MKIEKIEDIQVWQKSKDACLLIYSEFKNCKDFKFRDQIQSAGVSVMNNIAEGYKRRGNKELVRFLYISKGSAGEVRSMLYLAQELKYIDLEMYDKLTSLYVEVSKMLAGFISKLQ